MTKKDKVLAIYNSYINEVQTITKILAKKDISLLIKTIMLEQNEKLSRNRRSCLISAPLDKQA